MSIFSSYRRDKSFARYARPGIFGLISLLVFVALILTPVVTRAQQSGSGVSSTNLNTSIELETGRIDLSYSSSECRLDVTFSVAERKQEFTVSSRDQLGILIEVSSKELRYSVCFLETGEVWEPGNITGKRTEISLNPGWHIVLVEREMDRNLNT